MVWYGQFMMHGQRNIKYNTHYNDFNTFVVRSYFGWNGSYRSQYRILQYSASENEILP